MENQKHTPNPVSKDKGKEKKKTEELFKLLYSKPMSRRMAATLLGFTDQTYMVTKPVYDWLKHEKACIVGKIKCSRSGRFVQGVTTNPEFFPKSNQLNLFE